MYVIKAESNKVCSPAATFIVPSAFVLILPSGIKKESRVPKLSIARKLISKGLDCIASVKVSETKNLPNKLEML